MDLDSASSNTSSVIQSECLKQVLPPLPGEMLASYIARIAVANGLEPIELIRRINPETCSGKWILYPPQMVRRGLSRLTNLEDPSISEMTFDRELQNGHYPFAHLKDAGDWLIPVPDPPGRRPSLSQFCPECLLEDRVPHLRKAWRFAFLTHCPIHRVQLLEACPNCESPQDIYGDIRKDPLSYRGGLFLRCPICGFHLSALPSLRGGTEAPTTIWSIRLGSKILRAMNAGWTEIDNVGPIATPLLLPGLRIILRLLGMKYGLELLMWSSNAASLETEHKYSSDNRPYKRFEDLPVERRARLLAIVDWYLEDWPDRFVDGCSAAGLLGSFVLEQKRRELPFWLASAISDPLRRLHYPHLHPSSDLREYGNRGFGDRGIGLDPNTFDRIYFIEEHPEWWKDLSQMALGMRDMGLYRRHLSLSTIERTCQQYLGLIVGHRGQASRKRKLSLSGYFNRRALQRKFLAAFKRAIASRIGLL